MMPLRRIVLATCLAQAIVLCFALVPVKILAYPATLDAPAIWLVFDPNTLWMSRRCISANDPMGCFQAIGELFQILKALSVRVVICLIGVTAGFLAFRQFSAHLNRTH